MRDYLRVADLSAIPEQVIRLHDDGTGSRGELQYRHTTA